MEKIDIVDIQFETEIYKRHGVVEVYSARLYRKPHEVICVKKIYVESATDANEKYNECLAMLSFNHPNIVNLRSCILSGANKNIDSVHIIMEFFPEGDLDKFIIKNKSTGGFSEETLLDYASQLINGLSYMQLLGSSHRDIKPQNIFVANNGKLLKIGDLGSATKVDREVMSIIGTPLYLSPIVRQAYGRSAITGVLQVKHNPYKSDVFSLGLVLLYMASLRNPVGLMNLSELEESLKKRFSEINNKFPKTSILIEKMLQVSEENRPDFIELQAFFNSLINGEGPPTCGRCKNPILNGQFQEFRNSKLCSDCFHFITNLSQYCTSCDQSWPAKNFYNYNHTQFCKFCVSKINFFEDKLVCLVCENRIQATLECKCLTERCHLCKGPKHVGFSCYSVISSQESVQNYTIGFQCDCEVNYSRQIPNQFYYYCQTEQKYFCIVCCLETSSPHPVCGFMLEFGNNISQ